MKNLLLSFLIFSIFSGCCGLEETLSGSDSCLDQIFTETRKVSMNSKFGLNDNNFFTYANKITSSQIKSALQVPNNGTVKKVSLNSAVFKYSSYNDNACRSLFVNLAVISSDGQINFLILKEQNLLLPLILGQSAINSYLNTEGVKELDRALQRYAANTADSDLSFILSGDGLPKGSLAHWDLTITMEITVVYEVCRYAPLGAGERVCE
jgi:hypothetical protein